MPSFDIVCQTDMQEVDNAVNSVRREFEQRYDFKGSNSTIERSDEEITVVADSDYQLGAIGDMLKVHFTRRKLEPGVLDFKTPEKASGNTLRQQIVVRQGISSDVAKKIVKEIKTTKMKVQAAIRGEEVRVEGKKRDDLQATMQVVRDMNMELPVQFINFRD